MKKNLISNYLRDFTALLFPDLCFACSRPLLGDEKFICLSCEYDLPETHFDVMEGNPVEQSFWGRTVIFSATAYVRFEKGNKVQHLMHALKYNGQKELGVYMGELMGRSISENSRFNCIDAILPVPLHPKKYRKRTYNQSECLAAGIGNILQKPVLSSVLIRKVFNPTQTKKGRYQRWENVEGIFEVTDPELLQGKHLLLVDDVITTGSTLEAAALPLANIINTRVSVMTFALA
ncbi:ComF family protein [Saccharicrinis sp. FJH54]|uniref:ComF family protein n=1 Tax=Saccharicrinis sp. FJH54 TaxID=3344665 RepID=UPI0035D5284A